MKRNNSIFGNLDDAFLFCTVIEEGSLSKAALKLSVPASTISRRLTALQARLGTSLLQPHKRELMPTEVGQRIFDVLHPSLWQLDAALGSVQSKSHTLQGTVRITVPRAFYYDVVRHAARKLRTQYPNIHLQVTINQSPLVASLDLHTDILMTFDDLSELGECVAVPIYKTKLGIYAHRDFFQERPFPEKLTDLEKLPWICNYQTKSYPLYREEVLAEVLEISPVIVVNDILAVSDEVRAMSGIGLVPIAKAVKHKELVRLFPDHNGKIRQSYLVYRKHRFQPKAIQVVVQEILEAVKRWRRYRDDWAEEHDDVLEPTCSETKGSQSGTT